MGNTACKHSHMLPAGTPESPHTWSRSCKHARSAASLACGATPCALRASNTEATASCCTGLLGTRRASRCFCRALIAVLRTSQ